MSAAVYLGQRGPASAEAALWGRLEALWSVWRGRSSELSDALRDDLGTGPQVDIVMLEEALAAALSGAKNWKLSPEKLVACNPAASPGNVET